MKAELFKTLGHPARSRILELLGERPRSVGEVQVEVGLESSHMSQQLAVLRRVGVVVGHKRGNSVIYALASDDIADLLAVARQVLGGLLNDQVNILRDLEVEPAASTRAAF